VTGATPTAEMRRGVVVGAAAYLFWGIVPLYWKQLHHVPATEILAHRTVWGGLTFVAMARLAGEWSTVRAAVRDPRVARTLLLSGTLLSINWLTFIYAVGAGHLVDASLGYFINPLISVVLGMVVLGERLRRGQWIAVALAAAGVIQVTIAAGTLPWIALVLASSFGLYGLVRKTAPVASLPGSTIETLFIAPIGAFYLIWQAVHGSGAIGHADLRTHMLLAATGLVTALPLLWFTSAARRLPLSVVGFLQYLAPTGQLLTAVLVFGEPFSADRGRAFLCIWAGLAIFMIDALYIASRRRAFSEADPRSS
jgi:chloramphenicol-sensitive protein RarD